MTYDRGLERYLKRISLQLAYTAWAHIAQNRADWRKRVAQSPFAIGKHFFTAPQERPGGQRGNLEDEARSAAETAERQTNFDLTSHAHHNTNP